MPSPPLKKEALGRLRKLVDEIDRDLCAATYILDEERRTNGEHNNAERALYNSLTSAKTRISALCEILYPKPAPRLLDQVEKKEVLKEIDAVLHNPEGAIENLMILRDKLNQRV